MYRTGALSLCALVLLALTTLPAHATSVRDIGLDEQAAIATTIVKGRVTGVQTVLVATPNGSQLPYTEVTLAPDEFLKGTPRATVRFRQLGGPLPDGRSLRVEGAPEYAVGDVVCLLLREDPQARIPIVGIHRGYYALAADPGGSEPRVLDRHRNAVTAVDGYGRITRSPHAAQALRWSDFRASLRAFIH